MSAALIAPRLAAERVGQELARLGCVAEELQQAMVPRASDHARRSAQSLDLLTQTLHALARFMVLWGGGLPDIEAVDLRPALTDIRLADLARRLAAPDASPANEAGMLELFDA